MSDADTRVADESKLPPDFAFGAAQAKDKDSVGVLIKTLVDAVQSAPHSYIHLTLAGRAAARCARCGDACGCHPLNSADKVFGPDKVFGTPSIRTDVPAPRIRRVAEKRVRSFIRTACIAIDIRRTLAMSRT